MTYISTINAIPTMTSNTAPSGVVSASSVFVSGNEYLGFSDSSSDWRTNTYQLAAWLRYDFPKKTTITKYSIAPFVGTGAPSCNPKDWTFEGSNDGTSWTILDTQTNQTGWSTSVANIREYSFTNNTAYEKYRLNVSSNNGHASWMGINRLMMFELIYDNKILLLNDGKLNSIVQPYYSDNLIPNMTGDTIPSGVVESSGSTTSSYPAYYAFNEAVNYHWVSSAPFPQWISYEFPQPTQINKYELTNGTGSLANRYPIDWNFEGSDDRITWTVLHERRNETWTATESKQYTFQNSKKYKYYRLIISRGNDTTVAVNRLKMYQGYGAALIELDKNSASEGDFLTNGMGNGIELDYVFDKINSTSYISTQLGSGKLFEKSIDLSKRKINKIKL